MPIDHSAFITKITPFIPPRFSESPSQFVSIVDDFSQKSQGRVIWTSEHTTDHTVVFNNAADLATKLYHVKISRLLDNIIRSILEEDYLSYALYARSLFENAATLHYYIHDELLPIVNQFRSRETISAEELKACLDIMDKMVKASRFNWEKFLTGDISSVASPPEDLHQISVGKCIKTWAACNHLNLELGYALLCDCVHPNAGSNLTVMKKWPDGVGFGNEPGAPVANTFITITFYYVLVSSKELEHLLNSFSTLRY
jgi:hypothetical protein